MLAGGNGRSMNGAGITRLFESGTRFFADGGESGQIDSDLPDSAYASQARVTRSSVEAVSEIRIQTSAFSAEYVEALGGVVNFITKSGTNQFHASLFEYFRNEKLDSRNYFNVAPQLKPPFRLNQFGGTLGGPIIKDRLFFFGNYEGVRQRLGINQNTFVPTVAFRATLSPALRQAVDELPLPNGPVSASEPRLATFNQGYSNSLTENTFSIKTDCTISAKDRLSVRYNYNSSFTKSWFRIADDQFRPVDSCCSSAK
jgi:outer membrane receptor protein involved in Fe transport